MNFKEITMSCLGTLLAERVFRRCGWIILLISVFLSAGMSPPVPAWAGTDTAKDKWPSCDSRSATQQISFVHVGDIHAQYNPENDGSTPVGRIRGYYETVRKANPYTLFTNAGDDYEKGSVAEELSQGQSTREVVQALGYDVRTLGNHDFAWGIDEVLRFSNDPRAVVLAANAWIGGGPSGFIDRPKQPWTDYAELTVGCVKIGFFGLTTRPYGTDGRQHDGPIYENVPALESNYDHLAIAKQIIAQHRQDVDLLVLVSHLGVTDDILVAAATTGIDLILGGHSHTVLDKPIKVKDTQIVHAGSSAEYIGRYDIRYNLNNRIIMDSSYQLVANRPGEFPSDKTTDLAVAGILHRYQKELSEAIAVVKRDRDRPAVAGIAAQAVVKSLGIDAAFIDMGSVRPENWQGELSRQDILDAFRVEREPAGTPGGSSMYLMQVKGLDLLDARLVLKDFAFCGPRDINPGTSYTVAMQKAQALGQQEFFGRTISFSPPRPAAELWQIVSAFALDRRERGLTIDEQSEGLSINDAINLIAGSSEGRQVLREGVEQPRS